MPTNQELIKKADIALSDLSTNGGLLNPEQTDRFLRTLMDSPTLLNSARVVAMNSPQKKINKIGFGSRIMRPATSVTALAANDRVKPDLSQIQLNTKEVMAEIRLPYEVLEDNIEGGNIGAAPGSNPGGMGNTVIDMIAERAALDFEELGLLGDTLSGDTYLALVDGWLKRTTAHVVDGGAATISKALFKAGVKAMPDKYLRNRNALRHVVSVDNETEYRDTVANRTTGLGDAALQTANDMRVFGSPIMASSMMPAANGLYTNPLNLLFGIQRRLNIEYDKDIRTREFIVVLTARVDFQIEEVDAVVRYNNIG